jgi:hypothetical protein
MQSRSRNVVLAAAVVVVVAVGGGLGLRAIWDSTGGHTIDSGCTFGAYQLDTSQTAVASTMVGVVTNRGLPERAAVLVLAAGLQESKLRNLAPGDGDRDSVGVLQQRPSQGWGTPADLNDVHYATGAFLSALIKIANWQTLPLAEAVQDVQISADGSAYAPHEAEAQALADRLMGKPPAGLTCTFTPPTTVATPATVAASVRQDLPVNPPTTSGLTVSVPGAAWQTAAWFVANADRLGLERVAYDNEIWTRTKGWKPGTAPATAVVATIYSR